MCKNGLKRIQLDNDLDLFLMYIKSLILCVTLFFSPFLKSKEVTVFKSQIQQSIMIELYSSQGCSSCPPAQRWISRLMGDTNLWNKFVPVVFHVDYWNDLGWIDPFSNNHHSKRQRNYLQQKNIGSVYTPGFVINGKEWRSGEYFINETNPGVLQAFINDRKVNVQFENNESLDVHVVVLGTGIKTEVNSGENSNRVLVDDFVVLSHQRQNSENSEWEITLPEQINTKVKRYGLAIWVSYPGKNAPIQSTGGWLPEKIFSK